MKTRLYTESEVLGILSNLVNGIRLCAEGDIMPKRYKQKVDINGEEKWVTGSSLSNLLKAYLELCIREGTVIPAALVPKTEKAATPLVGEYVDQFTDLYKSGQESLTKETRTRIIENHIKPRFGDKQIGDIGLVEIQKWFNELEKDGYSHESLLKIKNIFSPALDAAVEDGYLQKNPFRSTRFVIGGRAVEHHKAIPGEKMKVVRSELPAISDVRIRMMLGLLSYTGMRLEEILGLWWEDIDFSYNWIYVERAVIHPNRNQPEVKEPKSKSSKRRIPLPDVLKKILVPKFKKGFVLWSVSDFTRETPLSYTEARRVFSKIRDQFELKGYSAHDFRDTCATEWREAGVPTDVIARLLGHAKSDITETRYVKYRDEVFQGVRDIMNHQNGTK